MSVAAPQAANIGFANTDTDIIPSPIKPPANSSQRIRRRLPSISDGPIPAIPRDRRRMLPIPLGHQSIEIRKWEEREAERRRARNSDGRTRRPRSGIAALPLAEAAIAVASRTRRWWQGQSRRRSRKHRPAAGRDRKQAAAAPTDFPTG